MSKFSRTIELNQSSIVASGHPPIIHNTAIKDGVKGVKAGTVVQINPTGCEPWDAAKTFSGPLGIALNEQMEGDTSLSVLLHGCYRQRAVKVAGAPMTVAHKMTLAAAGLFAEDSWGA